MAHYVRNLPHYQPDEATFLITSRLVDSIPIYLLEELRRDYEREVKCLNQLHLSTKEFRERLYILQKKNFAMYDKLLDNSVNSPKWLIIDEIAEIVSNKLREFDGVKYELIAYSLMPNHFHLVAMPYYEIETEITNRCGKTKDYIVADFMRLIKGSTARYSNEILNRKGSFWHHESHDHVVRDEEELDRIIKYVLNDPVKAGLVNHWKDWKWSYCMYDYSAT